MLLMEMLDLKKDMEEVNDDESIKYFPYWIYDRFNRGKDRHRNCKCDHLSMSRVLKILSDCENLQIPLLQPSQSAQTTQHNAETWRIESSD
ncbi:hypothetical protein CDL12_12603 [Handroanthus impetiginosus]|uniref:Uncharacterized protein n=1 Tax=Handroanthus impetiginosus TaxID=429701 RepID=A0A2G9HB61_9LAMI|nr:hypothetical protein CDL12_12603 [Handroanthus impetiginosus]